jgi:hypothetical protein
MSQHRRPEPGETWLMQDSTVVFVFKVHDVYVAYEDESYAVEYSEVDAMDRATRIMGENEWIGMADERLDG